MIRNLIMAAAGALAEPPPTPKYIGFTYGNTNGASQATVTINAPANVAAGDLLVAVLTGTTGTISSPGWLVIKDALAVAYNATILTKVSAGNEPASYIFTTSSNARLGGYIIHAKDAQISVIGVNGTSASLCVAPSITLPSDRSILFAHVGRNSASITATVPTGMTLVSSNIAVNPSTHLFVQEDMPAGDTGTRTSTVSNSASGCLFALGPIPPETVPIVDQAFGDTGGSNTTSITLPVPAGTQPGDLMTAMIYGESNNSTWNAASGWELLYPTAGAGAAVAIYYRYATAGEPPTYTFTHGGSGTRKSGAIVTTGNSLMSGCGNPVVKGSVTIDTPGVTQVFDGRRFMFCGINTAGATVTQIPLNFDLLATQNAVSPSFFLFTANTIEGESSVASVALSSGTGQYGVQVTVIPKGYSSNQVQYGSAGGRYVLTVPTGIASLSAVMVGSGGKGSYDGTSQNSGGGGGSLGYKNNIAVVGGQECRIKVGAPGSTAAANAESTLTVGATTYTAPGSYSSSTPGNAPVNCDGGGVGGAGGNGAISDPFSCGGGAGGYAGAGGRGLDASPATAGTGGAGGGGSSAQGGGGVGLKGQGASGAPGGLNGGSGGANGVGTEGRNGATPSGGNFGGGGVSWNNAHNLGARGAVRILWPGATRQFPSTNVGDI